MIAESLAEFVAELKYESIPPAIRKQAKLHLLDSVGVALASSSFDFAHKAFSGLAALGTGEYDVIGMPETLPLRDAVLMNGMLVHGLEFDDTSIRGRIHPSAFCVPCALGMGVFAGASGKDALVAYVAGVECALRIGMAAKGGFSPAGCNSVGIVGAFGSVLTAGKLLGLNSAQLAMAQGIVYSTVAGNREFTADDSWTKRLEGGWPGVGGITAAMLASKGYIGPRSAYEGKFGLFNTYLEELGSSVLNDAEIRALAARVDYKIDPQSNFPAHYSGGVEVTTVDGRVLSAREDINAGSIEKPLRASAVEEKFLANAQRVMPVQRAKEVRDLLLEIDSLDNVGSVTAKLVAN